MDKIITERVIKCNTVGDLLDALAGIAKDAEYSRVLDASIESDCATFIGFRIYTLTLPDESKFLGFELLEEIDA